jgi:hypothetical protein
MPFGCGLVNKGALRPGLRLEHFVLTLYWTDWHSGRLRIKVLITWQLMGSTTSLIAGDLYICRMNGKGWRSSLKILLHEVLDGNHFSYQIVSHRSLGK